MNLSERFHLYISIALLIAALLPAHAGAQDFGHVVSKHGAVNDDLYLAGGQVDLYASVDGDVVVAGGQLHLEGDISADVIAAGGRIELRGNVMDDARVAGGDLRISGRIGDDLVAAGGRIHLSPVSHIGGRAWLSGGEVRIDGVVDDELRASGGRIVITGTVGADVELWADQIIINDGAVISGNLHYRSAKPASIASGARIEGTVTHTPVEVGIQPVLVSVLIAGLLMLVSSVLAAVVLYLLFPEFAMRVSQGLVREPLASFAVGLAVFAATPVLVLMLFASVIGFWLALALLAVYLLLLLAGYFAGAMAVGTVLVKAAGKADAGKRVRAGALALAICLLAVINLIPLLGALINWVVLLAGVGALGRQFYQLRSA